MAFEKVVGRPHPKFHRTRPVKKYVCPTSISSEATRAQTPGPSFAEDELEDDDDDDNEDDGLQETNNVVQESRKMTPRVIRRTKYNSESQTEGPNVEKRQKTVSQSWTSTFSYERTSSSSESDIDRFSCEDDSPNEVRQQNAGSVRNFPAKTFDFEDDNEEEDVRALSFNPETEAEIRLRATSLRCLRKKLRDGSIDVSKFDSYQQLKIFQDILRQEEEKKTLKVFLIVILYCL